MFPRIVLVLAGALPLWFSATHAQMPMQQSSFTKSPSSGTYVGPGDVVSGALLDVSVRAYTAAYATGSNASGTVERASDSTTHVINILTNGNFDAATANTFCTSTTCAWENGNDQSGGNGQDCTQVTAAAQPPRISNDSPFTGYNDSLQFNGGPLNLYCGAGSAYISGSQTIMAWVKRTDSTNANAYIIGGSNGSDPAFGIDNTTGKLKFDAEAAVNICNSTGTVALNTWTHVALAFTTGTGCTFYINGSAAGTVSTSAHPTVSSALTIGAGNDRANGFTGNIAEVLIYSGALTATQIGNIYSTTSP